jgi:poly(3-hydroxybutyrate) depolymerase
MQFDTTSMTQIPESDCGDWDEAGPRKMPSAIHALRSDPRFSYTLYVPPAFWDDPGDYSLLVMVHDTTRDVAAYRDGFSAFARISKTVLLAPLFPAGVLGDGSLDGYKHVKEGKGPQTIRYDLILLAMVKECAAALRMPFDRFMLFGYSGGGQFVHRFFYLHPQRLSAVSIGAPGSVTRIDPELPWWLGIRDMQPIFGRALDIECMRRVPVQMVVGAADIEELTPPPQLKKALESSGDFSRNRVERLHLLRQNFERHGIDVQFDLVPHAAHDAVQSFPAVEKFFLSVRRQPA